MTDKQKRDLSLNVGDREGSPLANDEAFMISFLFLHKTFACFNSSFKISDLNCTAIDRIDEADAGGPHSGPGLGRTKGGLRQFLRQEGLGHLIGELLLVLAGRLPHLLGHLDFALALCVLGVGVVVSFYDNHHA